MGNILLLTLVRESANYGIVVVNILFSSVVLTSICAYFSKIMEVRYPPIKLTVFFSSRHTYRSNTCTIPSQAFSWNSLTNVYFNYIQE